MIDATAAQSTKPDTASRHLPLLAPGVKATGTIEVRAPFDDTLIATVDCTDDAGVDQALSTAHALFRNRDVWLSPAQRIDILNRTADLMKGQREDLALEAAREGGKPLMDSLIEVDRAINGVKLCADGLAAQAGTGYAMNVNPASMNRLAYTTHEPIGVVVAFSAFNHPLNLIVHQVGPAVAAGCPFIVKPAKATPISCWRFVELLREAGWPEEWGQALLIEKHDVSTRLMADPRVGFFGLIGSADVGWDLRSKLAPGTRCALEHGGVAPVIVAADADLDDALPLIAKGGFYHAGQVCVSVQRIYVENAISRDFARQLAERAIALKVGDPTLPDTEVGPLIRHGEVTRVKEWIDEAVSGGGELLCGGELIPPACFQPTVLFNPPDDVRVSTHEVFGPVVCVYSYDDIDDAINRANSLDFAFQAAVFTKDINLAMRAYRRLDASTVMINDHTAFRVDWMPFGGLKHSGLGIGGIHHTMRDMQIEKLMVLRSPEL